jgi:hypothetical protein
MCYLIVMRLDEDTAAREQHRYHIGAFFSRRETGWSVARRGRGRDGDGTGVLRYPKDGNNMETAYGTFYTTSSSFRSTQHW